MAFFKKMNDGFQQAASVATNMAQKAAADAQHGAQKAAIDAEIALEKNQIVMIKATFGRDSFDLCLQQRWPEVSAIAATATAEVSKVQAKIDALTAKSAALAQAHRGSLSSADPQTSGAPSLGVPVADTPAQMMVTIPVGVMPGQQFVVDLPSGLTLTVPCPPDKKGGEELLISVPASPVPMALPVV